VAAPSPASPPAPLARTPAPPAAPPARYELRCDQYADPDSEECANTSAPNAALSRGDAEELRRLDAMRRDSRDERALTKALLKLAHDADFETETSRQAFLAACASLTDDDLRAQALVALLRGAPISVDTGRGVLAQAQRIGADKPRAKVLSMLHHIRESELVRGPLAGAYLDVAGQLQSQEALANALRELLHPEQVPSDAVERALGLLQRVEKPAWRKKVLAEVTDHQLISPAVEAAYAALISSFDAGDRKDAEERLADALEDRGRARSPWRFSWSGPRRDEQGTADSDARRAARDRVRAEVQKQLLREREALRHSQQQLQESARQLREQARQLAQQYKERSRALQEKLKKEFGADVNVDLDTDIDVDVDTDAP
jgi:hypothetical protein